MRSRGGGVPVTPIVHDDASSSVKAISNVQRLISDDHVDVLIGPYGNDLTRAVVPVARRHGRVVWNHGGAADDIHGPGDYVVGVLAPVSRYFAGILDLGKGVGPAAATVVVVHRNGSRFGALAAGGTIREAHSRGFTITALGYASLRDDLPRLLKELRGLRPDVVLSAGLFQDDCTLAHELLANKIGAKALGCVAAGVHDFWKTMGLEADGFFGPSQWEPAAQWTQDFGPSAMDVTRSIMDHGATPDYPAAQAYAACLIAQHCLEQAGNADDELLWKAACGLECTTFFGCFNIDSSTGLQLGKEMVSVQWQGGQKRIVWPPAMAETNPEYPGTYVPDGV